MFFKVFKKFINCIFCKVLYRVECINIPNDIDKQSYVVCANHTDWMDAVILWSKTPNVRVMAKAELFKIPVFGRFIRKVGAFPIKRAEKDFASIHHAIKLITVENSNLVIFPEGTRRARQKNVKPKIGAVYISLTGNVPILPVYIQENKRLFRKIKVVYGEKIDYTKQYGGTKDKKVLNEITANLMDTIYDLGKE